MNQGSTKDEEALDDCRVEVEIARSEESKEQLTQGHEAQVEKTCGDSQKQSQDELSKRDFILEKETRFSQSILWEMMRRFYADQGVDAWSLGIVPHFITCNAFIARSYAKIIQSYLSDLHTRNGVDPSEPVYIIELGVGSGKFSFLLLKALVERMELLYGDEPPVRFKYVLTDFCETPFRFWRTHPALQRYLNAGLLDFAKFDACNDDYIHLQMSGTKLREMANPPIVVANYLFDTLPADAFRVKSGELCEGFLSVRTASEECDKTDPTILNRFTPQWSWRPAALDGSRNSIETAMLSWYSKHFDKVDASFLIPTQSFRCLDRIRSLSRTGRIMLLSGDKGQSNTISLQQNGLSDPHIAIHGSFSLMVNYHAIGLWFQAQGGFALHCPLEDASLKVSCFVIDTPVAVSSSLVDTSEWNCFGEVPKTHTRLFSSLKLAFREAVGSFGPDHFFHLQQREFANSTTDRDETLVKAVIALLQLSDWDADLVFKYRDVLLNNLEVCNVRLLDDLRRGMERAWENYFLLEHDKDFAFELGRFHYGLQEYERALVFYSKSSDLVGKHHVTEHNIGLCHASLGNKDAALERFKSCLEMNPTYTKAIEQQAKLLNRKPSLLMTRRDLIEHEMNTKSPQNSRHVRISFDPEVIERAQSPQCVSSLAIAQQ